MAMQKRENISCIKCEMCLMEKIMADGGHHQYHYNIMKPQLKPSNCGLNGHKQKTATKIKIKPTTNNILNSSRNINNKL